jgi:hypothetical protein
MTDGELKLNGIGCRVDALRLSTATAAVVRLRRFPPFPPPSSADKPGDFGEDCLSAQREFRSRPAWRATQGTPEGGGGTGSPSLDYLPWRSKKGNQPPGCPRLCKHLRKALKTIRRNALRLLAPYMGWRAVSVERFVLNDSRFDATNAI